MLNHLARSISRLIYRQPVVREVGEASKETARRRLQQVLVEDRIGVSSDTLDAMKRDLIKAVARHLRIERDSVDMQIRRSGNSVILKGNIRV